MDLLVLAAGRGSRFYSEGVTIPKPLVSFREKPLFWWAVQSALSCGIIESIHFSVLNEHISVHKIDTVIRSYFPSAKIHILDEVTQGAAETTLKAVQNFTPAFAFAVLDCDLAFGFTPDSIRFLKSLQQSDASAILCTFRSDNPAFSFAQLDQNENVVGAVEKKVVSDRAIAGMYIFRSANLFLKYYFDYEKNCNYSELFLSGLIDRMAKDGERVRTVEIVPHISMGTPKELANIKPESLAKLSWYGNK